MASKGIVKDKIHLGTLNMCTSDADPTLREYAVEIASTALAGHCKGEFKRLNEVAENLSAALTEKYGGAWHAIVGKSFGSFVTHESSTLVYFFLGQVGFLLFKHG